MPFTSLNWYFEFNLTSQCKSNLTDFWYFNYSCIEYDKLACYGAVREILAIWIIFAFACVNEYSHVKNESDKNFREDRSQMTSNF